METIQGRIEKTITPVRVQYKKEIAKLLICSQWAEMRLCERARKESDVFTAIPVVAFGQLFGGKICAALDGQHLGDLFDVKYLLGNKGFPDEVRQGFLFCLTNPGQLSK